MMSKISIVVSSLLLASAASAQELPQANSKWFTDGQARVQAELAKQPIVRPAKNIVLVIGDGNGVGTNYATRLYMGQQDGGYGDDYAMSYEKFPNLALVKTYNTNAQTPDSAGTSTAMMTGVKTKAGVIGVGEQVKRGECATLPGNELANVAEIFSDLGKAVGFVTTARVTHATPAGLYAHTVDRNFEAKLPEGCTQQKTIAEQLLEQMSAGHIDVALGGGRRNFLGKDMTDDEGDQGRREDGQDLIKAAKEQGIAYAWNSETAAQLPTDGSKPLLGLFEDSHMAYETDRSKDDEPSLSEMTKIALQALANNEQGYFLQVESGRVDHAQHDNNLARSVTDGAEMARTVALIDEMTDDEDTLIIVTADHEHAFALNGYCGRGSNILGLCMEIDPAGEKHAAEPVLAEDGKPFTVGGYLNGVSSVLIEQDDGSYRGDRPTVTEAEASDVDYVQQALIPLSSESHSGEDVAVYAKGPYAHLFDGTIEQNVIFHIMHHAATAQQ